MNKKINFINGGNSRGKPSVWVICVVKDACFQICESVWFLVVRLFFPSTGQILQKDQEIKDLKQKIAEVMAVMPSIAYTAGTSTLSPVSPHYSSKFVETSSSGLDPNASVYQPLKKLMPAAINPLSPPWVLSDWSQHAKASVAIKDGIVLQELHLLYLKLKKQSW